MIKRKTYSFRGGDILDIEEYHDGRYGAPGLKRMKRRKATKEDMLRVNKWNKEKRCRQRLLQYFKETDLFLTWTYSIEERPPDMQAALKDFRRSIAKVRRAYRKRGYELFWIRNIEQGTKGAWHIHLIVNEIGDSASIVQKAWDHGGTWITEIKRSKFYSSGVSSKAGQASSGGKSLGNNAKSGAGSVSGHDPGYNFGKGFVGGIGSWIKGAASKAAEMAKAAYNAAKHALDEHSPSKLTRKLGRWFSEGFGLGIDDEAKSAVQSAETVAEKAVSAIDTEAIADKLKGLDLAEIMPQVYATVADQQNYMERKLTTPVASMENHRWRNNNTQTVQMSEEDIEKLAKSFARAASKEITSEMDGMKFTANQRELGRFIREAKA